VAVASARYTSLIWNRFQHPHIRHRLESQESAYFSSFGERDNFEILVIPIHEGMMHWSVAIYQRDQHVVRYYNTLAGHRLSDNAQRVIEQVLNEMHIIQPPQIQSVPQTLYNTQVDGVNCGFHASLIVELYLYNDGQTYIQNIDIQFHRRRMLHHLLDLLTNDLPEFEPVQALPIVLSRGTRFGGSNVSLADEHSKSSLSDTSESDYHYIEPIKTKKSIWKRAK
jgi:hypothetical protein